MNKKIQSKYAWSVIAVLIVVVVGAFGYLQYGQKSIAEPQAPQTQIPVQAEVAKVWRIGVAMWKDKDIDQWGPFQRKMEALGHKEGVDVEYVVKNAKEDKALRKQHIQELLADESLDIVYSIASSFRGFEFKKGEPQQFSTKVVFSNIANFERLGLTGLYSPTMNVGGNFTGVLCGNVEFVKLRMELLKDIVPDAKVIGIVMNPDNEVYDRVKALTQEAAAKLGVEMLVVEATDSDEALRKAKEIFVKGAVDGIVRGSGGIDSKQYKLLAAHLVKIGIPAVTFSHTSPVVPDHIGAIANDPPTQARQAAVMIDRIMRGTNIDDIPVEFAENLETHVNTAIAEKAGITIPERVLLQAAIINTEL